MSYSRCPPKALVFCSVAPCANHRTVAWLQSELRVTSHSTTMMHSTRIAAAISTAVMISLQDCQSELLVLWRCIQFTPQFLPRSHEHTPRYLPLPPPR